MPPRKKSVIQLEGVLNVQRTESLYTEFKAKEEQGGALDVDFSSVTDIDFAALQLLCSLGKTYSSKKRKLQFVKVPDNIKELFELSDFNSLIEEK